MIQTWMDRMPARLPESMIDCAMMQITCMAAEINELRAALVERVPLSDDSALQMALDALIEANQIIVLDSLDKAIEAIRAELAKPDGWLQIETAPKDGTRVLFLQPDGSVEFGWWSKGCIDWFNGDFYISGPTHWMPLPRPPTP